MYYQSILPTYPPSRSVGEYFTPTRGVGEYFTPTRGVGEYFEANSALGKFTQAAAGITGVSQVCSTGVCGVGQTDSEAVAAQAALGVAALAVLGLWIYMGYKIGEDLSPNGRNWGVGGAFVSLLGPFAHWGYGVMALSNGR